MQRTATHLRLVEAEGPDADLPSGLGPASGDARPLRPSRRTAAGRPGDELSPWWLPECRAAERLALAAAERGIEFPLAVATVLERSLVAGELTVTDPTLVLQLDELARDVRLQHPVGGAAAVYLRQLSGGAATARASVAAPVSLPARVTARMVIAAGQEITQLLDGDLDAALAWERAAVLEGRTIAEWTMSRAVALLRG